jgi:hypothetical protein
MEVMKWYTNQNGVKNPNILIYPYPTGIKKKCKTLTKDTQVILKRGVNSPTLTNVGPVIGKCIVSIHHINNVINEPTQLLLKF